MMEENELWFWLLSLERLGPVSHRRLFEYYGDIREIWRAKNPPLTEKQKDEFLDSRQEDRIRRSFHEMRRAGIRMVTAAEPDYPRRLRAIYDAPYGLFVKGELPNPNAPAVAIIGHAGARITEALSLSTQPRNLPAPVSSLSAVWPSVSTAAAIRVRSPPEERPTRSWAADQISAIHPPTAICMNRSPLTEAFCPNIRRGGKYARHIFLSATGSSAAWPILSLSWKRENAAVP